MWRSKIWRMCLIFRECMKPYEKKVLKTIIYVVITHTKKRRVDLKVV